MILFAGIVIVYAGIHIRQYLLDVKSSNEVIDKVRETTEPEEDSELIQIDWESLKSINKDIVGWIDIPNSSISYPVLLAPDNSYYLSHGFDKSYSSFGAIFMDYNTILDEGALNVFIYGHSSYFHEGMFTSLQDYKNKDFYQEHPYFYFYTPTHTFQCFIFSFYVDEADSDSYTYDTSDKMKLSSYIRLVKSKALYKIDFDEDIERVLTLYTCSFDKMINHPTQRYFLHASIEEIE